MLLTRTGPFAASPLTELLADPSSQIELSSPYQPETTTKKYRTFAALWDESPERKIML